MAVLSSFFILSFCHPGAAEDPSPKNRTCRTIGAVWSAQATWSILGKVRINSALRQCLLEFVHAFARDVGSAELYVLKLLQPPQMLKPSVGHGGLAKEHSLKLLQPIELLKPRVCYFRFGKVQLLKLVQ